MPEESPLTVVLVHGAFATAAAVDQQPAALVS
jgi:hypothetical protein